MKLKKVLYFSPEFFIDVDIPVLETVSKHYDLLWILLLDNEKFYKKEEIATFCKGNNIKYLFIKNAYRRINPLNIFSSLGIIKIIKKFNPNVYYFEQFSNPYFTILIKLLIPTKKIIVSVHDVEPHQKHTKFISRLHKKFYLSIFKNYQVFSNYQAEILERKYSPFKIYIIPLNLKDFGEPTLQTKTSSIPEILFFGKIHFYKGLDILIDAVNKIPKEYKFSITIAGMCNNFEIYKKQIENDVYNYEIRLIENEEIPDLFMNHDYIILPYRDVTQSGPLHIAYFYNIPAIASDLPGFRDYIIDNETGFLFEKENAEKLSETLKAIVVNHKDKYPLIKKALKQMVKDQMSQESIGKLYIKMFNEIK